MSSGCIYIVVRRYIDFLISSYYLSLLFLYLLFCSIPTFSLKCFSFLFQYIFVIYLIIFSRSKNKHNGDYGCPMEAV